MAMMQLLFFSCRHDSSGNERKMTPFELNSIHKLQTVLREARFVEARIETREQGMAKNKRAPMKVFLKKVKN